MVVKLPEPMICDMNCFLGPGHEGPHQFDPDRQKWKRKMAEKADSIQTALDDVADAAKLLAIHGAGGYSLDTSALDTVFLRSLRKLHTALTSSNKLDFYDPSGDITYALTDGVE